MTLTAGKTTAASAVGGAMSLTAGDAGQCCGGDMTLEAGWARLAGRPRQALAAQPTVRCLCAGTSGVSGALGTGTSTNASGSIARWRPRVVQPSPSQWVMATRALAAMNLTAGKSVTGGALRMTAGQGTGGSGGHIVMTSGEGTTASGAVSISSGEASGAGEMIVATGSGANASGAMTLGTGTSTNGATGSISMTTGAATGGAGGAIT